MMELPVYLMAGFLDSGKTNFINGILEEGFARDQRTLLLCCEEGEEEYEKAALDNVTVVTVEEQEQLTNAFLKECQRKYRPQQVIIEYNGMWPLEPLYTQILPANWILYQIMTLVDARSFDVYAKTMGQMMMEKLVNADMIVFNRCDAQLRTALRKRNLKMVNRRAEIYLENADGSSEEYDDGSMRPFDLSKPLLEIPDEEYGVWYVDVMDHPKEYDGKKVRLKMLMCKSKKYKGVCCPGRFAMICCEKDVTFLGLVASGGGIERFENRDWIQVEATIRALEHPAYKGVGPVLQVESAVPCAKPAEEVVSF